MGVELQQILRGLCLDTEWHYAVYWKLRQHNAQMLLSWEDAHFGNSSHNDLPLSKSSFESDDYMRDGRYIHDSVALAMTAMSYDVYPFGEGIIGQVAANGKHQWVFRETCSATATSFQEHNGWETQFSAGIKTVAVISVASDGVLQLGSFCKVDENIKLVDQIRNSFLALQISSVNMRGESVKNGGGMISLAADNDCGMLPLQESGSFHSEQLGRVDPKLFDGAVPQVKVGVESKTFGIRSTQYIDTENALHSLAFPLSDIGTSYPQNTESYGGVCFHGLGQYQDHLPPSQIHNSFCTEVDIQSYLSQSDSSNSSLKFSAGCELHEALGPAFLKQPSNYEAQTETSKAKASNGFSESSHLTPSCGSEHLLEAVVASILSNKDDHRSSRTSKSLQSILTTEYIPEPCGNHTDLSAGPSSGFPCSEKEDMQHHARTSDACFTRSSSFLSSTCVSSCTEPFTRSAEPAKGNKKRARPGETSKPRPRDRQLIQDRIKELRELIPSGAKCSIDALLERTIKHMLFMQNMTEHADKLTQCAESKTKDAGGGSSSHEQGSSWAVEVGGHLKVCRILVENVNMNRQMLIEMLCEECSHFLEIAEVIKNLGLTILKGATEACGEKTWICFLVEGQKNKSMQRMDILWSLVHVLQPNSSA